MKYLYYSISVAKYPFKIEIKLLKSFPALPPVNGHKRRLAKLTRKTVDEAKNGILGCPARLQE